MQSIANDNIATLVVQSVFSGKAFGFGCKASQIYAGPLSQRVSPLEWRPVDLVKLQWHLTSSSRDQETTKEILRRGISEFSPQAVGQLHFLDVNRPMKWEAISILAWCSATALQSSLLAYRTGVLHASFSIFFKGLKIHNPETNMMCQRTRPCNESYINTYISHHKSYMHVYDMVPYSYSATPPCTYHAGANRFNFSPVYYRPLGSGDVVKGGPFNIGVCCFLFCFLFFSWLLASVASGFCGFWLSWLLWLLWLLAFWPIHLSIYIYFFLSFFLSFCFSFFLFGSCSPFSFCICFSCCLRCRDETKQASNQASKQSSKHEQAYLWIWRAAGGGACPPQPPPRHEICTSSPTPAPATKSIF